MKKVWVEVSRTEAEKLFEKAKPGTYLFRKDIFASCLEEILISAKREDLRCFTLSYVDGEKQVHDKTIVKWKNRWMFYDDDPTLSGDYYHSFEDLLLSMKKVLKHRLSFHLIKAGEIT